LAAVQLVPNSQTNPPSRLSIAWDSPQTKSLFYRSCADCHSNATIWPWYSQVAPVSWLITRHVKEGRLAMNISVPGGVDPDEAARQIRSGEMPMAEYLWLHPEAQLTGEEKEQLIEGLGRTF